MALPQILGTAAKARVLRLPPDRGTRTVVIASAATFDADADAGTVAGVPAGPAFSPRPIWRRSPSGCAAA